MALPSKSSKWAWLPKNLLDTILDNLIPMVDCIRFSAVFKHWQSVTFDNFQHVRKNHKHDRPHQQQLHFLLVPIADNSSDCRCLYDVTRKSLREFQLKIPYNIRTSGYSHGWLIFVNDSFQVTLFNHFLGKSIHLPPLKRLLFEKRYHDEFDEMSALPHLERFEYVKRMREECDEEDIEYEELESDGELELEENSEEEEIESNVEEDEEFRAPRLHQSDYSIVRGVLSADPDVNGDFVLIVIYGLKRRLAFIKYGDKNWTYIDKDACDFFKTTYAIYIDWYPKRGL